MQLIYRLLQAGIAPDGNQHHVQLNICELNKLTNPWQEMTTLCLPLVQSFCIILKNDDLHPFVAERMTRCPDD